MTRRVLVLAAAVLLLSAACSSGGANAGGPADLAGVTDPLAFDDPGVEDQPTATTEVPSGDAAGDVDPVIVEGLAQAVVADQSGQTRGVVITIDQARCLSARTVLALGVERLAELSFTGAGLADGGVGAAIGGLSPAERAAFVDATLECVPVEVLIGTSARLTDQETACLVDELAGSDVLRALALGTLASPGEPADLDDDAGSEYLDAIRTCVDLAAIMFATAEVSAPSIACVGDAVSTDPLLDEVFAALLSGQPVSEGPASALQAIVEHCLSADELAALP